MPDPDPAWVVDCMSFDMNDKDEGVVGLDEAKDGVVGLEPEETDDDVDVKVDKREAGRRGKLAPRRLGDEALFSSASSEPGGDRTRAAARLLPL